MHKLKTMGKTPLTMGNTPLTMGNTFEFVQIYLPITFMKEIFLRYDAAKMLVCSYNESLRK